MRVLTISSLSQHIQNICKILSFSKKQKEHLLVDKIPILYRKSFKDIHLCKSLNWKARSLTNIVLYIYTESFAKHLFLQLQGLFSI